MAFTLEALLARPPAARALAAELGSVAVPLTEQVALVPLPGQLTAEAEHRAAEVSRAGVVAYVEAEYFGGVGEQRAVVWRDGAGTEPATINDALQILGVRRTADRDEFDSIGLGRHRTTRDWSTSR